MHRLGGANSAIPGRAKHPAICYGLRITKLEVTVVASKATKGAVFLSEQLLYGKICKQQIFLCILLSIINILLIKNDDFNCFLYQERLVEGEQSFVDFVNIIIVFENEKFNDYIKHVAMRKRIARLAEQVPGVVQA